MKKCLRPTQRIRRQHLFQTIVRKGKFVRSSHLRLWAHEGAKLKPEVKQSLPMMGVIVGRKTDRHANIRNLWKRRIREVFRLNQDLIKRNSMIVIQAVREALPPSFEVLEKEMMRLWANADILRSEKVIKDSDSQ